DYDKLTSELEKLKNRIGKEQHEKHVANDRIKELQAELDKYKQEQVDKDPEKKQDETAKQLEELKKKNEELNQQLVRNNRLNEVNSIFKKSGLNISDGILNMIVTDPNDGDSINANTQAIVDLIRQVQSDSKKELLRGNTPKASGGEVDAIAKALGL
ncbi:capsid assembly scaffolding protein Gp46 family protein, partial [Lactobacillus jensenii]